MSIRRKILICSVVMLLLPILLILLLSICMVAVFALLHPFSPAEGVELSNPIVMRYIVVWAMMAVAVVITCGAVVTAYLSRSILHPISEITVAMEHMKNGDLTYEFSGSEDAELRELCSSFETLRLHLQKNVEENLRREQEQKMLLANISHDIKTPVTSIRGYVEGIMEGIADTPEKMNRYLQTIHQKASAIEIMVNHLSLYSKLTLQKIPYHMENGDVFAHLRRTLQEFELELQDGGMRLTFEIPKTPCDVCFDEEKLRRVYSNIITNAIKYKGSGDGGLHVAAQVMQGGVMISFSDQGIGIAAAEQEKVFEGFYRSDPSRNSKIEGNGLGLAICRQIIADHNGKIWIRSEEGEGTCVTIFLPGARIRG